MALHCWPAPALWWGGGSARPALRHAGTGGPVSACNDLGAIVWFHLPPLIPLAIASFDVRQVGVTSPALLQDWGHQAEVPPLFPCATLKSIAGTPAKTDLLCKYTARGRPRWRAAKTRPQRLAAAVSGTREGNGRRCCSSEWAGRWRLPLCHLSSPMKEFESSSEIVNNTLIDRRLQSKVAKFKCVHK